MPSGAMICRVPLNRNGKRHDRWNPKAPDCAGSPMVEAKILPGDLTKPVECQDLKHP